MSNTVLFTSISNFEIFDFLTASYLTPSQSTSSGRGIKEKKEERSYEVLYHLVS